MSYDETYTGPEQVEVLIKYLDNLNDTDSNQPAMEPVSYTHLRAHET